MAHSTLHNMLLGLLLMLHSDPRCEAKASTQTDAHYLRVLNLNAWGLAWPWSRDRRARLKALHSFLTHSDYDVVLLQEVWYRDDHRRLRSAANFGTHFSVVNAPGCDGVLLPWFCSGLLVLSRHPIVHTSFRPFSARGDLLELDGEVFVQKGVAKASIDYHGLIVDVFTAHLISYTSHPDKDNRLRRYTQTREVMRAIKESTADIKLFGGDLNALPSMGHLQPYTMLLSIMRDPVKDMANQDQGPNKGRYAINKRFATFCHPRNKYAKCDKPERIDYVFYNHAPWLQVRPISVTMPHILTRNWLGKLVSVSDHEPIRVVFEISSSKSSA